MKQYAIVILAMVGLMMLPKISVAQQQVQLTALTASVVSEDKAHPAAAGMKFLQVTLTSSNWKANTELEIVLGTAQDKRDVHRLAGMVVKEDNVYYLVMHDLKERVVITAGKAVMVFSLQDVVFKHAHFVKASVREKGALISNELSAAIK